MTSYWVGLGVACLARAASAVAVPRPPPQAGYEQVYEELRKLAPRADRVATVREIVLRRDVAEFTLHKGTLYLLTPVAGRTVGAAFVGQGSVSFTPPLPMERASIWRALRDSALVAPITAAVFVFADSTLAELERRVTFGAGQVAREVAGRVGDALDFLVEGRERRVDASLMTALLNRDANGFFAAYVKRQRGEDLLFKVDPHEVEEIALLRRGKLVGQRVQTVTQFQRAADLRDSVSAVDERPEPLRLESYRIEATIADNFDFSATATIRVTAKRDSLQWARFVLFSELEVDSVIDGTASAAFFRTKRSPELWVRLEAPLRRGDTRSIRVTYHGDLIAWGSLMEQFLPSRADPIRSLLPPALDRWLFIKSTGTWFPRYGSWQAADMELIFHTPSKYRFASIGRLAESRVEQSVLTTRWVTEAPTQVASFNIGEFDEFEITDPRIPPVTVHMNKDAHRYLDNLFLRQQDPQEQVGGDVANSLAFFTRVFGPPMFQRYYATEIPYFHGQAFPGLIHLSWWTFQSTEEKGWEEIFRAHEMAHQWWGIGVEPAADRDAWLAEGFAMFAGLWYMQQILRDNDKYFKQLKEWRGAIRAERNDAPPVGLGYRALETDPEHYPLIVYRKGAWVLHMLRNLMLDLRTMKEDAFTAMMQDFYQSHRGRRASTQDFQRVVERHMGLPMGWFFDQWVYGTVVPTFTLSWHVEPAAGNGYLLRVRVRPDEVPANFIMPVPLVIHFADSGKTMVRVNVRAPVTDAKLLVPAAPVRLELNPLESVLAEVKQERWRPDPPTP
ncbi:MAG: M1 family aminopeptidase [Gemmatimonadales bacterium]